MGESVHPTALVDPKAELGAGVRIGAYTIVGPEVALDDADEVDVPQLGVDGRVVLPHVARAHDRRAHAL